MNILCTQNEINTRLNYIDIARGLGMFAVIWGHIMSSGYSYFFVYSFHMPLYFFLSGMMYKNHKYTSLNKLLKSRTKSLLMPYVFFSVITWVVWICYNIIFNTGIKSYFPSLMQTFIAQGSYGYLEHNAPLWFVTCLFVVEIAYYFISKTKYSLNLFICVLIALVGHFMLHNNLNFDFTRLPWNIEVAFSALLFYSAGNIFVNKMGANFLQDFVINKKHLSLLICVITVLTVFFSAPLNGHITLGGNSLGYSTVAFYLLSFMGITFMLLFSALIDIFVNRKSIFIYDFILWIGRNSFYFMAIHRPITSFITSLLAKLLHTDKIDICNNILYSRIAFIITVITSSLIVFIINSFNNAKKSPCSALN